MLWLLSFSISLLPYRFSYQILYIQNYYWILKTETHFSDFKGKLETLTKAPVDGDYIDNIQAGHMYYDNVKEIIYIYDGTAWYGRATTAS